MPVMIVSPFAPRKTTLERPAGPEGSGLNLRELAYSLAGQLEKRGQIFVTCESGEPMLGPTVDELGEDFIGWASDYPHWDSEFPQSSKPLRERGDLSETARAAILGGNALRFFGLG